MGNSGRLRFASSVLGHNVTMVLPTWLFKILPLSSKLPSEENVSSSIFDRFAKKEVTVHDILDPATDCVPSLGPVTKKVMANVLASAHMPEDDRLAGGDSADSMEMMARFAELAVAGQSVSLSREMTGRLSLIGQKYRQALAVCKECNAVREEFSKEKSFFRKDDLTPFTEFVSRRLAELKEMPPGDFRIYDGGYTLPSKTGHAMRYVLEKTMTGGRAMYRLKVINTGEGVEAHGEPSDKRTSSVDKEKVISLFTVDDIEEDSLPGLLTTLFKFILIPDSSYKPELIYTALTEGNFGTVIKEDPGTVDELLLITEQWGPNCFHKSDKILLRLLLADTDVYKALSFDFKLLFLINTYRCLVQNNVLATDGESRFYLEWGTRQLAGSARTQFEKGRVDEKRQTLAKEVCREILREIKRLNRAAETDKPLPEMFGECDELYPPVSTDFTHVSESGKEEALQVANQVSLPRREDGVTLQELKRTVADMPWRKGIEALNSFCNAYYLPGNDRRNADIIGLIDQLALSLDKTAALGALSGGAEVLVRVCELMRVYTAAMTGHSFEGLMFTGRFLTMLSLYRFAGRVAAADPQYGHLFAAVRLPLHDIFRHVPPDYIKEHLLVADASQAQRLAGLLAFFEPPLPDKTPSLFQWPEPESLTIHVTKSFLEDSADALFFRQCLALFPDKDAVSALFEKTKSNEEAYALLFVRQDKDVTGMAMIPEAYYLLRDASFCVQWMLSVRTEAPNVQPETPALLKQTFKLEGGPGERKEETEEKSRPAIENFIRDSVSPKEKLSAFPPHSVPLGREQRTTVVISLPSWSLRMGGAVRQRQVDESAFPSVLRFWRVPDPAMNALLRLDRKELAENRNHLRAIPAMSELDARTVIELANLRSEPSLQVISSIYFFKTHLHLLSRPDVQRYLDVCLFETEKGKIAPTEGRYSLLATALTTTPELVAELEALLHSGIEFFYKHPKMTRALCFMLNLCRKAAAVSLSLGDGRIDKLYRSGRIRDILTAHMELHRSTPGRYRRLLSELIRWASHSQPWTTDTLRVYMRAVAEWVKGEENGRIMEDEVLMALFRRANDEDIELKDRELEDLEHQWRIRRSSGTLVLVDPAEFECRMMISAFSGSVTRAIASLGEAEKNGLLNEVMGIIAGVTRPLTWQWLTAPDRAESSDGEWQFMPDTLEVYRNHRPFNRLPETITSHESYKEALENGRFPVVLEKSEDGLSVFRSTDGTVRLISLAPAPSKLKTMNGQPINSPLEFKIAASEQSVEQQTILKAGYKKLTEYFDALPDMVWRAWPVKISKVDFRFYFDAVIDDSRRILFYCRDKNRNMFQFVLDTDGRLTGSLCCFSGDGSDRAHLIPFYDSAQPDRIRWTLPLQAALFNNLIIEKNGRWFVPEQLISEWLPPYLVKGCTHWLDIRQDPPVIEVVNGSGSVEYTAALTGAGLRIFHKGDMAFSRILNDKNGEFRKAFKGFVSPDTIKLERLHPDTRLPDLITLCDLGLSFRCVRTGTGQTRFESVEFSGYRVAANQWLPELTDTDGYLILVNDRGEEMLLLNKTEISSTLPYTAVALSADRRDVMPSSRENTISLAWEYFDARSYEVCFRLLRRCQTDMRLTEAEFKTGQNFSSTAADKDKHPNALACRLLWMDIVVAPLLVIPSAHYGELLSDYLSHKFSSENFSDTLTSTYKEYLKKYRLVSGVCRLPLEAEFRLLQWMNKSVLPPVLQRRLEFLKAAFRGDQPEKLAEAPSLNWQVSKPVLPSDLSLTTTMMQLPEELALPPLYDSYFIPVEEARAASVTYTGRPAPHSPAYGEMAASPFWQEWLKEDEADIAAYLKERTVRNLLREGKDVFGLAGRLERMIEKADALMLALQTDLKELLETSREGEKSVLVQQDLLRLSGRAALPDMGDYLDLFLEGKSDYYSAKTFLSDRGAREMDRLLLMYFLCKTRRDVLKRARDMAERYLKAPETSGERNALGERLGAILAAERAYSPDTHPELCRTFLVLEYLNGLMLYPFQVEKIALMTRRGNLLIQLIMGSGKSLMVMPCLALALADGKSLVMVQVPPELFSAMKSQLQGTYQSLGRRVHVFEFSRSPELTAKELAVHLDRFKEAVRNKDIILMTPQSQQSLEKKFDEWHKALLNLDKKAEEAEKAIARYRERLSALKETLYALNEQLPLRNSSSSEDESSSSERDEPLPKETKETRKLRRKMEKVKEEMRRVKSKLRQSEKLKPSESKRKRLVKKVTLAGALIRLMATGKKIVEEGDTVYKTANELNFTEGTPKPLPSYFWTTAFQLTALLRDDKEMNALIAANPASMDLVPDANGAPAIFHLHDEAFYHTQLKPVLARRLLDLLAPDAAERDMLLLYLCGGYDLEPGDKRLNKSALMEKIKLVTEKNRELEALVESMAAENKDLARRLSLLKEYLTEFLPFALMKRYRVDYGPYIRKRQNDKGETVIDRFDHFRSAIPYANKDEPKGKNTGYQTPEITILLTMTGYEIEGLTIGDLTILLRHLITKRESFEKYHGVARKNPADELYSRWMAAVTPPPDLPPEDIFLFKQLQVLSAVDPAQPAHLRLLHRLLRCEREAIGYYLSRFVFPQELKHYPGRLSSNAQDLGDGWIVTFTGTVDNKDTFPPDLTPVKQSGTDARVLDVVTRPQNREIHGITFTSTAELLDLVVKDIAARDTRAFIDAGALVTGMSNLDVARYILARADVDGVVYMNDADNGLFEKGEYLIIKRHHKEPVPLKGNEVARKFTYYDHAHTTGVHIDQIMTARAVITVSAMMRRDFGQGAMRMRELAEQQTLVTWIPERILAHIRRYCGLAPDGVVVMDDVLIWLTGYSVQHLETDIMQSALQKVMRVIRRKAHNVLLAEPMADTRLRTLCLDALSEKLPLNPLKKYLRLTHTMLTATVFDLAVDPLLTRFGELLDKNDRDKIADITKRALAKLPLLWRSCSNLDSSVESVAESETIRETENVRQSQNERFNETVEDLEARPGQPLLPGQFFTTDFPKACKSSLYRLKTGYDLPLSAVLYETRDFHGTTTECNDADPDAVLKTPQYAAYWRNEKGNSLLVLLSMTEAALLRAEIHRRRKEGDDSPVELTLFCLSSGETAAEILKKPVAGTNPLFRWTEHDEGLITELQLMAGETMFEPKALDHLRLLFKDNDEWADTVEKLLKKRGLYEKLDGSTLESLMPLRGKV